MKKYFVIILGLLVTTILVSCAKDNGGEKVFYNGIVGEVREGEFDFTFDNNDISDTMIVISDVKDIKEGDYVKIETNGSVMLSEPARVNATKVEKIKKEFVTLECNLLEIIDEQYIMVSELDAREGDMIYCYKVDYSKVENLPEVGVGTKLSIKYDGNMTKSILPMLTADYIDVIYPER